MATNIRQAFNAVKELKICNMRYFRSQFCGWGVDEAKQILAKKDSQLLGEEVEALQEGLKKLLIVVNNFVIQEDSAADLEILKKGVVIEHIDWSAVEAEVAGAINIVDAIEIDESEEELFDIEPESDLEVSASKTDSEIEREKEIAVQQRNEFLKNPDNIVGDKLIGEPRD